MAIVGFVGFGLIRGFSPAIGILSNDFFETFSSYSLTVIPLFVLMGQVAYNAGIARKLYDMSQRFLGRIPGGLGIATIVGATIFKSVCGSATATCATFASVAVPEMDRFKYSKALSTGSVAITGTLGAIIPPSVFLIIYGLITEQSIGKLFLAGIVPGIIISFLYVCVIIGWVKINPSIAPKSEKYSWREKMLSLPAVIGPIIIFTIVIGGLMEGFFTPTEGGSVGTFAVLLLVIFRREINFRGYIKSVSDSLSTASMVLLLLAGSAVFGHFLAVTKIPLHTASFVSSLPVNRHIVLVCIMFIMLIGGSFMDDLAFMVLAIPIFFPVIVKLGFDPIWFGIVLAITLGIGGVIPPVALNVFIVQNITKQPIGVIYKGVYPFMIALVVASILLFLFPGIALWLPYGFSN
jgi:tripartite ATP-independent transporter DctM subunit